MNHIDVVGIFVTPLVLVCLALIGLSIERVKPAPTQPESETRLNLAYTVASSLIQQLILPVASGLTVYAINTAGGGWIVLPSSGWPHALGFLFYAFTLDLFEYLFHRMQHAVPALWSMHSLHHSDTSLNASTTYRHFWAESAIKTFTIYAVAGMLFKADPAIIALYAALSVYNLFPHMNLRIGFGRWSWLMNSPQYHRIHHSALPEHFDCNFAGVFPIFDVIFRTYRAPRPSEFPKTGIAGGDRPMNFIEVFAWPMREQIRRSIRGQKSVAGPK